MIKRESETFQEELEDTNAVIRILKSKMNRQHNGQYKRYKRTNSDLQDIHIKLMIEKHEPTKTLGILRCSGMVSSSCFTSYKPGDKS